MRKGEMHDAAAIVRSIANVRAAERSHRRGINSAAGSGSSAGAHGGMQSSALGSSTLPIRLRNSGKASFSNQGLSRSQRIVCQLGCGSTKYSGRNSRQRPTVSVIECRRE
jgi:hypothetical protein